MVLTLRRLITELFGSDKVEQVDVIHRTGAERAAQRDTRDAHPDTPALAEAQPQSTLPTPEDAPVTARRR